MLLGHTRPRSGGLQIARPANTALNSLENIQAITISIQQLHTAQHCMTNRKLQSVGGKRRQELNIYEHYSVQSLSSVTGR